MFDHVVQIRPVGRGTVTAGRISKKKKTIGRANYKFLPKYGPANNNKKPPLSKLFHIRLGNDF